MSHPVRHAWAFASDRRHKLGAAIRHALVRLAHTTPMGPTAEHPMRAPSTLFLRVTRRCNLHCTLCGQWGDRGVYNSVDRREMHQEELPLEAWKRFIDQVAPFRPYIMITGGELLLREDVVDLVAHVSRRGLLSHINSNSTLLESKADALVDAGLDFISFSLDAPETINARITGSASAYRKVIAGITRLAAARDRTRGRLPRIQMFTVISERNQRQLYTMAEIAEQLGVDTFVISFPIFTTAAIEQRAATIFRREFGIEPVYWKGFVHDLSAIDPVVVEEQLERIRSRRWRFAFKQFPAAGPDFDAAVHFRNPEINQGQRRCGLVGTTPVILPNGDVSTCWDHPDVVVGNILSEPFLDIWHGERYRRFRETLRDGVLPTCTRCTGLDA